MSDSSQPNKPQKQELGRRTFLKRASTASLITVLPAKSVWGWGASTNGCTVSGNMSGNTSHHSICTVQGKSPGYWHTYCDNSSKQRSFSSSGSMAPNYPWKDVFGLGRPPFGNVKSSTGLHDFLPQEGDHNSDGGPDNINRHLVAAFYNALNGFYPLQPGVNAAQYVCQLYDEALTSGTYRIAQAIESTYS